MRTVVGSVVDGKALLEVVWVSISAGLVVTAMFAFGIVGTTRAVDMRRAGRTGGVVAYAALAVLAALGVAAAVVFAIVVMANK